MKTELKLERQTILYNRLQEFVNREDRLPTESDKFMGIERMRDLQHNPETILFPKLKILVCGDIRNQTKECIVRNKHKKAVITFMDTYKREPKSNSRDKEEKLLRLKSLAYPGVKEDPEVKKRLMEYFVPKLLTLDDACRVCYEWIVSRQYWPKQSSKNDLETRIHNWIRKHISDLSERYKDFLELERTLRQVRKREIKLNKVEFFKSWCEKYGDYPRDKYKHEEGFSRVKNYLASTYCDKTTSKLTEEEKFKIKTIAESYGWIYKPKPWVIGKIVKKNPKEDLIERSVLVYREYKELWSETKSKSDIFKEISDKLRISISTVEKIIKSMKKSDMSYNDDHVLLKDRFNRSVIEHIGAMNIKSILDPFAGKKSFYQDINRLFFEFDSGTEIITNDLKFRGHTYHEDARTLLDRLVSKKKKFDLVDLDPFDQPLYYISLVNLINMTNKILILTVGGMDRNKTKKAVQGIWDIRFTSNCNALKFMVMKVKSVAKNFCNKRAKLINYNNYGGTYRIAFEIKEKGK